MNLKPAALEKAESLARFAQHCGSPQDEFILALSKGEAYELLDYVASGAMGRYANHTQLELDVAEARAHGDPFSLAATWSLLGFKIVAAIELH